MRNLVLLIAVFVAADAWAVKPSHWTHTTEADFKQGTFNRVVATNLGDLKLSRQVQTLLRQDPRISAVYSLTQAPDGTIYAGTGPEGILLAIRDDKITTAAQLGLYVNIYSLLVDQRGRLLIGAGGEKGQVLRVERPGEKPQTIFQTDDVQYVWAMAQTPDGMLYAATGPTGKLFAINPDGTSRLLLDSNENNLLCLLSDGGDYLYVGTDPNGRVYRVNRHSGELFVVYDAPESEIGALARDARGNLYAGTAESTESGQEEPEGVSEQVGRPEAESHGVPIPSQPPAAPKPPEVPNPAPGEPLPIPKQSEPKSMSIMPLQEEDESPTTAEAAGPSTGQRPVPVLPSPRQRPGANGNAIYRIDPAGFVTEIFRQNVTVFSMIEQDGALLVATGNEGFVYQVNPAAEETLVLAKVDPKHVMCLLPARDGRVFMGMANSGDIAAMTSGYASEGTYTSPVLDASQISRFGKAHLRGVLPAGTSLKFATRSGNVDETGEPGWSNWTSDVPVSEFVQIDSPPARFLQYRLTFASDDGKSTPVVEDVDIAYLTPNLPPRIKSVKISSSEQNTPTSKLTIAWEASDPNQDELQYSLYFRTSTRSPWILMKDKLKDATYEWETRNVGDGRYQIKVEASDAAANPPGQEQIASRVSDPVIVDNTAPLIGDLKIEPGDGKVKITLKVVDRTSAVALLQYSVDSAEDWQTVLPSDEIADSQEEMYQFVVGGLSAGAHQITLCATDSRGNKAYESISVAVGQAK